MNTLAYGILIFNGIVGQGPQRVMDEDVKLVLVRKCVKLQVVVMDVAETGVW